LLRAEGDLVLNQAAPNAQALARALGESVAAQLQAQGAA